MLSCSCMTIERIDADALWLFVNGNALDDYRDSKEASKCRIPSETFGRRNRQERAHSRASECASTVLTSYCWNYHAELSSSQYDQATTGTAEVSERGRESRHDHPARI